MKRQCPWLLAASFAAVSVTAFAKIAIVPPIELPSDLVAADLKDLTATRTALMRDFSATQDKINAQAANCSAVEADSPKADECVAQAAAVKIAVRDYRLALRDFSDRIVQSQKAHAVAEQRLKNQVRTIDCAMNEVYKAVEGLGPQGREYVTGLREQVLDTEKKLSTGPTHGTKDARDVIAFSRDSQIEGTQGRMQFIVHANVVRESQTGKTHLDIGYSLGKNPGQSRKAESLEGQDIVFIGPGGELECQDVTPGTAKCMAAFNPARNSEHCPRPE